MKKLLLTMLPVLALALSAYAQDGTGLKTSKANTETVGFTVTGGMNLNWVMRDAALNQVRASLENDATPHTEAVIHGDWMLGFDVDLSEKVKIRTRLQNARFADSGIGSDANNADVLGTEVFGTGIFGQAPIIREASITLSEVLDPAVTIVAG